MILIELQYDSIDSTFLTLFDEATTLLDENDWVTISSSGKNADLDFLDLRKVPLAHA
jgi:hypothetical protein